MSRTHNISIHCDKDLPKVKFSNHQTFYTVDFKSSINPDDYSNLSIFLQELKDIIEFKNSVLSAFNKMMEELGYDK